MILAIKDGFFLRSEVLTAVNMKITVFWDVTPRSLVKGVLIFRRNMLPPLSENPGDSKFLQNILQIEVAGYFEALVSFYQSIRCHIPQECNDHSLP
jgi:hypothetical protein